MIAVQARDVFRIYSTPEGDAAALQGLNLRVEEGEVVVILGPSGSGKTSLLRLLAALDRPSAGQVEVFGVNTGALGPRAAARYRTSSVGYAEQHYVRALAPELRAREYVALPLALRGVERAARERRADELLERVGLARKRGAFPFELSGGEQQRVVVAAALAHRPRLLLADEPTGELDAANATLVYSLIGELARAEGTTTIIVSHDAASATVADRVLQISDGRVSAEAAVDGRTTDAIVVGRGGWLRLPEEWLLRARITERAQGWVEDGQIVLEPVPGETGAPPKQAAEITHAAAHASGTRAQLENVSKRYGTGQTATDVFVGLSASFEAGKLYALTGPSGSGKTTVLHLLAGLDDPTTGDVTLADVKLGGLDAAGRARLRAAAVGYVGQQSGLISFLSAAENVELGLALRGVEVEEARRRAVIALARVGLADRSAQRVSRLSNGEQARVALARAFAGDPQLILVDEPTARVDEANALQIATLLARLAHDSNTAVVCATHDPRLIEQADEEIALVSPVVLAP